MLNVESKNAPIQPKISKIPLNPVLKALKLELGEAMDKKAIDCYNNIYVKRRL